MPGETRTATLAQAGKYLSFLLGGEEYGLEILKVQEIIGMTEITAVPRSTGCMRGVIELRGRTLPVVDLRRKFDVRATGAPEGGCIIVVQVQPLGDQPLTLGVIVDQVSEVLSMSGEQILPPPALPAAHLDEEVCIGMGRTGRRDVLLLDIDRVLDGEELAAVAAPW